MSLDKVRRSSRLTSNSSGVKNQNMSDKSKKDAKGDPKGDARDRRESLSHSKSAPGPDADSFKKDISVMIAQLETRLSMKFNELENKVTKTMNDFRVEMREEMKKVHKEIDDAKKSVSAVSEKVSDLEKSVQFQSEQVAEIETKCKERCSAVQAELSNKLEELDKKLILLEKHDRKYNLLFYGFEEEASENIHETMRHSFINELHIDEERVRNMYFAHGHRLMSKSPGPKPIILRFTSFADRELVLSQAYRYAGRKKRVLVDLPEAMKRERNRLAKIAYDIRQSEEMKTRIRDKGLDMILEVKEKGTNNPWKKRVV